MAIAISTLCRSGEPSKVHVYADVRESIARKQKTRGPLKVP